MARSRTTVVKGQQLALKHGAFSAQKRLHLQNQVIEEARQRLKAGKLTPLEQDCYELLALTKARLQQVSAWLNQNGGALTPRGKLRETTRYELDLIKSAENQAIQLWKMLLAVPPDQQMDVDQARSYFATTYGPDVGSPDARMPEAESSTTVSASTALDANPTFRPAQPIPALDMGSGIGLS